MIELVRLVLNKKRKNEFTLDYEKRIDEMVYKIYDIPNDIKETFEES